ncbi:MAG: sulfur carrier protein ThiS [Pseudoramibacter sp.]
MVQINGEAVKASGQTIGAYLKQQGIHPQRVAVEYNGAILDKQAYDQTVLKDGDEVEIVSFVGGGC